MNSKNVANTVWALAKLDMPSVGNLRDALWTAAERLLGSVTGTAPRQALFDGF
jgi:hypothetical protein